MQRPLEITFRGLSHSAALETRIREKVDKLEAFFPDLISCRVMVEGEHHHHHQGNLCHVRIELGVPGKELVVSREHHDRQGHEDPYVVVRDAFDAARRQLEDYARRLRGDTKRHPAVPHGRIARLVPAEGYGFIETADGRQVYFHRNALVGGGFERLEAGMEVRFDEEAGEQGPQASTVHLVGKHHPVG